MGGGSDLKLLMEKYDFEIGVCGRKSFAQCERALRSGTEVYINQIKIPPVNVGLGMVPGMAAGDAPGGRILITVVGITLGTALMALGTPDAGAGFGGDKMTCRGRDANSLTTSTRNQ